MNFSLPKTVSASVSRKLGLTMFAGALVSTPLAYLGLAGIVESSFAKLEVDYVDQQVERVRNGVHDFGEEVLRATRDYAVWDDSFAYMAHPTKAFEEETLSPLAQKNLDMDFFGYVRFTGEVVRGEAVDLERGVRLAEETDRLQNTIAEPAFLRGASSRETYVTFVETPRGVYAVATGWVRQSDGSGTPAGFVVMARRMSSADLTKVLRVPVEIRRLSAVAPEANAKGASIYADDVVHSRQALFGPARNAVGVVEFDTARSITKLGAATITWASSIVLGLMLALILVLAFAVRRVVIRPLISLSAHMREVEAAPVNRPSPLGEAADEIGFLARTFDGTFEALRAAREKLREQSYLQGQSDSAAGTLHNLRNALGPVKVLQQKWFAEERAPWQRHLRRALLEVEEGATGERQRELLDFIVASARKVAAHNHDRITEMAESKAAIDIIVSILLAEQESADRELMLEVVDLKELLASTSSIARRFGRAPIQIHLPPETPAVLANRLQVTQLLGNVFKNAAEAIEAAGTDNREIIVTVEDTSASHIQLIVKDSGEGFRPEEANQLFEKGYSTRREKIGGIGLHWCANSAGAMGGSLKLLSKGPGLGATAILKLRRGSTELRSAA